VNILFNRRFVEPILAGRKIHTLRANYSLWQRHDGKDCSLRVWTGKPYRSPQEEFYRCRIGVQSVQLLYTPHFYLMRFACPIGENRFIDDQLALNDGFTDTKKLYQFFKGTPPGIFAILHFTDFRY